MKPRTDYHLGKLERTLAKADLLILDELSYLSFNRHQSELLFKVISDRSEKNSTIVTTNLPFSKWTDLFENTTMVAALIDRLTYRSHVLDMNGDSYRLKATIQSMNLSTGGSNIREQSGSLFRGRLVAQKFMSAWLNFSLTFTACSRFSVGRIAG